MGHARAWCAEFFDWYTHHHQYSGLALFTLADVFHGRIEELIATCQAGLDAVYAAHGARAPEGCTPAANRDQQPLEPEIPVVSACALLA